MPDDEENVASRVTNQIRADSSSCLNREVNNSAQHQSADLTKTEEAEQAAEHSSSEQEQKQALQIEHIIMKFKEEDNL